MLSGDECVPVSRCGCSHLGFYHKVEEIFHPSEREECECQAGGLVVCKEIHPRNKSSCQEVDGELRCSAASCVVTGDRSFLSFDGSAFEIPAPCSYILAESCADEDGAQHFVVKMKKDVRRKRKVSGIGAVSVEVYGLSLTLERGKEGTVTVRWHLVVAKLVPRPQLCHDPSFAMTPALPSGNRGGRIPTWLCFAFALFLVDVKVDGFGIIFGTMEDGPLLGPDWGSTSFWVQIRSK